ncbi:MAG: hypothetical protein WEF50_07085 [Myxococcota bacterium]
MFAGATDWPTIESAAIGLASNTVPATICGVLETTAPFEGAVMLTTGGVVSSVTETEAESEPATFVAVAVSVFEPSTSGTLALKLLPLTAAATPLAFTVSGGVPVTVPETAIGL